MRYLKPLALGAVILAVLFGLARVHFESAAATAAADPSRYTTIKVAASSLRQPIEGGATFADFVGSITAVVGNRVCAKVDLRGPSNTDSEGSKVLVVGVEGQPQACRLSSGQVEFIAVGGLKLATTLELMPGRTLTLTDLAPIPPGSKVTGFLSARINVRGEGLLRGPGDSPPAPYLVVLPAETPQPLNIGIALRYLYPFEESGQIELGLPAGEYLVTTSSLELQLEGWTVTISPSSVKPRLEGSTVTISVGTDEPVSVRAIPIQLIGGLTTIVDVSATRVTPDVARVPITPPVTGDGGLR